MNQAAVAVAPSSSKRLIFIDALRAYAILMMLQGHFVDTLLADAYRDLSSPIFATWSFMRGMTAPIFFTASGLIFVFLLLKDGRPLKENLRVKKGIRRGLFLVALGYLLKWNIFALITFRFYSSFITLDVLHSIGMALLALIGAYALSKKLGWSFPVLLGAAGLGVFFLYPIVSNTDWSFLPVFLQNYLTRENGSVFTPIPWIGYTLLGGVLGWHLHKQTQWYRTPWSGLALFLTGIWLSQTSTRALLNLHELTGLTNILNLANDNWLFWRLGHVLIAIALFIWITQLFYRYIPKLFLTIGSETLTIYSAHYVLLYGTWTGLGISRVLGPRSLNPLEAAIGALLFVAFFVYVVYRIEPIRAWFDTEITAKLRLFYRLSRVKVIRTYHSFRFQPGGRQLEKSQERL